MAGKTIPSQVRKAVLVFGEELICDTCDHESVPCDVDLGPHPQDHLEQALEVARVRCHWCHTPISPDKPFFRQGVAEALRIYFHGKTEWI